MRRSRAYPSVNVAEAYRLLVEPLKGLDSEPQTRASLASMLGYSNSSGGNAARKIASLVHYAFLDRRSGNYTVSAFGRYVRGLEPDGESWKAAMREALQRPSIFNDLLEVAREQGHIPQNLGKVLERDFGVTSQASRTVATIFWDSGLVAGLLEPDGTLRINKASSSKVTLMPERDLSTRGIQGNSASSRVSGPSKMKKNLSEEGFAEETREYSWTFPMSQGQARIKIDLPVIVSEEDRAALSQHILFYVSTIRSGGRQGQKEFRGNVYPHA